MARQQVRASDSFEKVDPVWNRIRMEAEEVVRKEPELATFIYSTILHHDTLEGAVVHRVAEQQIVLAFGSSHDGLLLSWGNC